ncbi:MAG: META domain-containing protein [Planctomycetota bacterium]|nr:META domain-containing protein [Planctomycetota bacterium]
MNLTRALTIMLALGLSACQSQKPCCEALDDDPAFHSVEYNSGADAQKPTGVRVTNISEIAGAWTLVALGTERVGEIRAAHPNVELGITFAPDGGAWGLSGVNRFRTKLDLASKELLFTPVISTKMAGPADLMQLEGTFHDAMRRAREIEFRGDLLALSAYGSTLATFRRVK